MLGNSLAYGDTVWIPQVFGDICYNLFGDRKGIVKGGNQMERRLRTTTIAKVEAADVFTMLYKQAKAHMVICEGKYVLLKGSTLIATEAAAAMEPLRAKRKLLMDGGLVSTVDEKILIVNENVEFDSASYAGSIVAGQGVNGLIKWKLNGKTLKEIELAKENMFRD